MKETPQLLASNMEILRRIQPGLARRLQERIDAVESLPEPVIEEIPKGRWVSGLTERPFFEPAQEKTTKKRKGSAFIVFGVGSPPYLFRVFRSLSREALAVIVVEPDLDLLLRTLSLTSVYRALPQGCRLTFIAEDDRALIDEALTHNVVPLGIFPFARAETVVHRGLAESRGDMALFEGVKREILYRLSQLGNSPEDTLLGVRHGALNALPILRSPSLDKLKEMVGGRPLVSVASGPSLEKNVHLLKGMEDRCVIVACDTVLLPLLRRGIRPHVVTTIERPLKTYETWLVPVLREFPEECGNILLLSQSVSYPATAGRWPGPKIVIGKLDSPADRWLAVEVLGKAVFLSGMSVAHMGLTLGFALESQAIALIGQDLAFGGEEKTHVEGAVSADSSAAERSFKRRKVPGSIEETVETHEMWHYFLQIFERFISRYAQEGQVHDCTEGGARIEGAVTEPFQAFLDREAKGPASLAWDPEALRPLAFTGEMSEALAARLEAAFRALDGCDESLDEMAKLVERAVSPALSPARRRDLAFRVAELLDAIHGRNEVLAFIGQSYTYLAGASLAETRFMETVEQVRSWGDLHCEIIASHRANVAFLRQWLRYVERLASPELREDLLLLERIKSSDEAQEKITRLRSAVDQEKGFDPLGREALLFSELLCRFDPAEPGWSNEARWLAARFFLLQGRAFDGSRLMRRVYEELEGQELPREAIDAFFLDWAEIEASHDLCEEPRYQTALTLLENVQAEGKNSEAVEALRSKVLRLQREYFRRHSLFGTSQDLKLRLLLKRNGAEEALGAKDLPRALLLIESMIDEGLEAFPGTVLPHLDWLAKTALDCREAADPAIAGTSREILRRLWREQARLAEAGFAWPAQIADYLREEGLQVVLETAENKKEQSSEEVRPRQGA